MKFSLYILVLFFIGIGVVIASSAFAQRSGVASAADFVHRASLSDMFEIQSSQIALDRARSEDVKNFAQRMIDDHTQASKRLDGILKTTSMSMTKTLDAEHQGKIDELNSAPDANFDNRYISMQIAAHERAVQLFSDYGRRGMDPALKSFASEMVPTLQNHLKEAQQIKDSL